MANGSDRDLRLDFFRGLALLMIFINHVPGNAFSSFTLANLGFSDAAEVFVFTAGFAATLAYARIAARDGLVSGTLAVFARVRQIYVAHLMLFLFVTAVTVLAAERFGDPMYLEGMALDSFMREPAEALLHVLTLAYQPALLDILPLYVVLLSLVPLVLLGFRLHPLLPVAVSAAVFAATRFLDLGLPNYPETRYWYFNPAAWQFLFVTGATVAHLSATGGLRHLAAVRGVVTPAAALYVAFAFLVAAPWTDIPALANAALVPASLLPPVDKTNLSLLRYANILAQVWLVAVLLPRTGGWLAAAPARLVVAAGKNSLDVFTLGLVLAVVGGVAMKETGYALVAQILTVGSGLALLLIYGHFLEWRAAARKRPAAVSALSVPTAKAAPSA